VLRRACWIWLLDRSFLKRPGSPNIPIQAIGLSLYESLGSDPVEEPGTKVTRTQWLDLSSLEMANLVGKNVLIVDEVDDTRTTLEYAVKELTKDVEEASQKLGRTGETTNFSIFVLHVCSQTAAVPMQADKNPRTRTSPKKAISQSRWWTRAITSPQRQSETSGFAIHGKLRTNYPSPDLSALTDRNSDIEEHDKMAAKQAE
jgi:hypoxanthine phosphoribosyltransferase